MKKFKIGNKVRVVKGCDAKTTIWADLMDKFVGDGEIYTILDIDEDEDCLIRIGRDRFWFPSESLELVKEDIKPILKETLENDFDITLMTACQSLAMVVYQQCKENPDNALQILSNTATKLNMKLNINCIPLEGI